MVKAARLKQEGCGERRMLIRMRTIACNAPDGYDSSVMLRSKYMWPDQAGKVMKYPAPLLKVLFAVERLVAA